MLGGWNSQRVPEYSGRQLQGGSLLGGGMLKPHLMNGDPGTKGRGSAPGSRLEQNTEQSDPGRWQWPFRYHWTWNRELVFSERVRKGWKALNTGIKSSELMSQTNKMELLFEQGRAWAKAVLGKIPITGVQVGLNRAKKA